MPVPIVCLTLGLGCLMPSCFATAPPEAPDAVDGRYIYFAPHRTTDTNYHGEVMRYDTSANFRDAPSWAAYDASIHGVGDDPDGYIGAVFDGHYVHFVPCHNGYVYHCEVLRYDTSGDFSGTSYWSTFDPSDHGVSNGRDGYCEGAVDDRHVCFVPNRWSWPLGQVLRFDTLTCAGDVDHDGDVDLSDLAQLLGHYGLTSGAICENGDLDADGGVNLSDLAALLGAYGTSCN